VLFAHDTEVALAAVAALVNTDQDDGDELADVDGLDQFVRAWGWTGERRRDQAELDAVRALRLRLRRLWHVDEDGAVDLVNELLRETRALPQLVKHDTWDYHVHATPPYAPLADRMAVEGAMALMDVIRQKELSRLQTCAADGCADVLVDLSKNRSRRFCGTSCANRTNMAAYRARQANRSGP
jgi:predicted RNA-binding Zn ribbon-like protein